MTRILELAELSIEQKIGQMLLARSPINRENFEFVLELVRNRALGGIHISKRYVFDGYYLRDQRELLDSVAAAADYPILLCEDMGDAAFPVPSEVSLPYQLAVGATGSEDLAYEYGKIVAIEARAAGYNLVFGPIVDIALNPASCAVGPRAFGGDRDLVARMASAAIRGYQDHGVIVTAKHYPGFGESSVDSHIGMVYLEGDEASLLDRDVFPYVHAMRHADLSGVMVGHIMVPKIDPVYPASISPALIGMLRRAGFDGLVMTDSFAMVGMTNLFPRDECYRRAMAAGNDMVLISYRDSTRESYETMLSAYRDGLVTEEQIDAAVRRVIAAQVRTLRPARQSGLTEGDARSADLMASGAITAWMRDELAPAIDTDAHHLFIVQEGIVYENPATGEVGREGYDFNAFEEVVRERFPNAHFVRVPEFPAKPQIEHVLKLTMQYRSIVMVLGTTTAAYVGSADVSDRMLSLLDGLRPKLEAVVLFGNPYAARKFGPLRRVIFGFDGGLCQRYAALTLCGDHQPSGRLPILLDPPD